jgi:cobalt transporter subunit CbtB
MHYASSQTLSPASSAGRAGAAAPSRAQVLASAFVALALGVTILWGVGFSHIKALHNAAHDTRHSNGFPCH